MAIKKTKKRAQEKTTRTRKQRKPAVEKNVAVYETYPDVDEHVHATEREVRAEVEDLVGTTARMTGCVLGLGSVPFLAPMLLAGPVLAAIGLTGAAVFNPLEQSGNDLKSREYRDEQGRIHHHTRTYMRDHAEEQMPSA